ncbi:MAG TPA: PepSY domain-containing protein, partial [Gammaproteobacteria bacterium]|nr:PepSY domain-containing protein [Gammaproteobacteria bacterium]
MSRHHRRKQRFKLRSFYVWHRYMGVGAAAFMLVIAVTGVLLNHTEGLQLDSRHVQSNWILDWYGIQA